MMNLENDIGLIRHEVVLCGLLQRRASFANVQTESVVKKEAKEAGPISGPAKQQPEVSGIDPVDAESIERFYQLDAGQPPPLVRGVGGRSESESIVQRVFFVCQFTE